MRIIVPAKFYVEGGIERVIVSLLKEFEGIIEGIVILLPEKSIATFQSSLPNSSKIIYESASWPGSTIGTKQVRLLDYLQRLSRVLHMHFINDWALNKSRDIRSSGRIRFLAKKYKCTHCLYFISNRVPFPRKLDIPVATICHDIFWHFAPMTYPEKMLKEYDESLREWLVKADQIITVSAKTRHDLLTIFPGFESKVQAIPSASDRPDAILKDNDSLKKLLRQNSLQIGQKISFFFPSSFSLYKDHLTLMQAATQIFSINSKFTVLLTGKDTERLASGDFDLAKQKGTFEYQDYVERLKQLHAEHQMNWSHLFWGSGYCDLAMVEAVYQTCSCVVMPSRYEGFGLAIAEAIVRGIPVIASDIEVFREQVELYQCADRVQFFEAGNPEALKDCLQRFLDKPVPRLNSHEASQRFDHWTWKKVAENYVSVLASLS